MPHTLFAPLRSIPRSPLANIPMNHSPKKALPASKLEYPCKEELHQELKDSARQTQQLHGQFERVMADYYRQFSSLESVWAKQVGKEFIKDHLSLEKITELMRALSTILREMARLRSKVASHLADLTASENVLAGFYLLAPIINATRSLKIALQREHKTIHKLNISVAKLKKQIVDLPKYYQGALTFAEENPIYLAAQDRIIERLFDHCVFDDELNGHYLSAKLLSLFGYSEKILKICTTQRYTDDEIVNLLTDIGIVAYTKLFSDAEKFMAPHIIKSCGEQADPQFLALSLEHYKIQLHWATPRRNDVAQFKELFNKDFTMSKLFLYLLRSTALSITEEANMFEDTTPSLGGSRSFT